MNEPEPLNREKKKQSYEEINDWGRAENSMTSRSALKKSLISLRLECIGDG